MYMPQLSIASPLLPTLSVLLLLTSCSGGQRKHMEAELLRAREMNKEFVNFTTDSVMKEVASWYDRHGTPNERMEAHYLLGCTYRDLGETPRAVDCYNDAADCADTTANDCDYHTLCCIHAQKAEIFHSHYQPRTAIKELQEAQRMAYKDRDTLMAVECFFDQSNEYERLGEADTAFAIAAEAARRFTALGKHDRAAAAKNATILLLLDKHRTDEAKAAIDAFLTSAYVDSTGNVRPGRELFYYKRGLYYLQTGRTDSAEYFFRKELHDGRDANNQIAGRKGLQMLYEKLGNADSVAKYAAEGYLMSDSVYMLSESQNLQSLQAMFDYNRNQLLVEQKTSELRKTRLYMVIAILSLLLVISVVVYLAQRRDRQRAIAATRYQTTIKRLSLEERLATSPIATHLQELANSNPPQAASLKDIRELKTIFCDNIPSFSEKVSPSERPISDHEYVVCLLTRLSFPSVSIDRLTGVSEGYTSKLKSRLYQKLTGEEGNAKDFERWIMAIK